MNRKAQVFSTSNHETQDLTQLIASDGTSDMNARNRFGVDVDQLQHVLLSRHQGTPFNQWPAADLAMLRDTGYMETTALGRRYVKGRRMTPETAEAIIHNLAINHGMYVRDKFHAWTPDEKRACPPWRAITKYVNQSYGVGNRGRLAVLNVAQLLWLRNTAIANPKKRLKWFRTKLFSAHRTIMSESRIAAILHETGLSRQNIQYIASQRFTQSNLNYVRKFQFHMIFGDMVRPAWFDESGINKNGMSMRRNDGWNIVGSGGAFLTMPLREWPSDNLTTMALIDRSGVFCIDVHTGGTDQRYVDNYMYHAANTMALRGCDCLILDNCPAHKAGTIQYFMNRRNIAVIFLPRYWPQFNPIELAWNTMKDYLGNHMVQLKQNPAATISHALNTIDGELAKSFIRHCNCYPSRMSDAFWNGPGAA